MYIMYSIYIYIYEELEENLADAYYKRSQAKLMTDPSPHNIESALQDTQHVIIYHCMYTLVIL